jgi:hypothetical protein
MPLSIPTLKQDILDERASRFGPPEDAGKAGDDAEAIATAVINHFIAMGLVTVAPGIGVTTPDTINGATISPGTGTIS